MGLRGRLQRLEREARKEMVVIPQRDGPPRAFDRMTVMAELYLLRYDRALGREPHSSEFVSAVEGATEEGRHTVEALLSSADERYSDLDTNEPPLEPVKDLSEQ
jgi:hypothetical protein